MKPILKSPEYKNKTEAEFALQCELRKRAGDIVDWRYEPCNFRMAEGVFYKPDFLLIHQDHFEFVEVKGFLRDKARVRFLGVAELYPWFKWTMLKKGRRGQWETMMER